MTGPPHCTTITPVNDSSAPACPLFPPPGWCKEGYAADRVDDFAAEVERAMRRRPPAMAPYEVADQRFPVHRRGRRYDLRAVDDYLEAAQAELRDQHGEDAVAGVTGSAGGPGERRGARAPSTWWIYAVGILMVAAILTFALTRM